MTARLPQVKVPVVGREVSELEVSELEVRWTNHSRLKSLTRGCRRRQPPNFYHLILSFIKTHSMQQVGAATCQGSRQEAERLLSRAGFVRVNPEEEGEDSGPSAVSHNRAPRGLSVTKQAVERHNRHS